MKKQLLELAKLIVELTDNKIEACRNYVKVVDALETGNFNSALGVIALEYIVGIHVEPKQNIIEMSDFESVFYILFLREMEIDRLAYRNFGRQFRLDKLNP